MILDTFPCGLLATNAILIACEETKKAILIDPAEGSFDIYQNLLKKKDLTPCAIYLTHSHFDHIADANRCRSFFSIPLFVHRLDEKNVLDPGTDGIPLILPVESAHVDGYLEDGQLCRVGELEFKVIHTPGHSPGSVVFYFPGENVLISGDTLFKGSLGNLSLATARPEKMWDSLKKLAKLPQKTKVYPGHGPTTTLEKEDWLDRAELIFG